MDHPDVVVLTVPGRLSKHANDLIKERLVKTFDQGQRILILDDGMTLGVVPNTPMPPQNRSGDEQEERSTPEGNRATSTD